VRLSVRSNNAQSKKSSPITRTSEELKNMKNLASRLAFAVVAALGVVPFAHAKDDLPWAFNGTRAQGYAIDLVSVEPAPGTPLIAGETIEFKITLTYSMSIAKTGSIVLVFQDDKNRAVRKSGSFVTKMVGEPSGTVTLTDVVAVPKRAAELRLFAPLVPEGLTTTQGEVTIRYPIRKK
jgi:hypothetical protein